MSDSRKLWIAGHRGLVGSALVRRAAARGWPTPLTASHQDVDLEQQAAVEAFVAAERPTHVVLAAAKVGGIHANNIYRAEFLYRNLMIAANVIHACHRHGVERVLFLGSSCIYPRDCPQPMREEALLSGPLERTNEPYAIAKIAGVKLIETYNHQYGHQWLSAMPTNLYGPGDNYDLATSHVLPALIRKFHEAKMDGQRPVTVWGSGTPKREFLFSDDCADACLFMLEQVKSGAFPGDLYNIGSGEEVTIRQLAEAIQRTVGHQGELVWDGSKPDGTPRKLQDTSRLDGLGWRRRIGLDEGLRLAYQAFLNEHPT
jgi:GDP-L-fucose synthase